MSRRMVALLCVASMLACSDPSGPGGPSAGANEVRVGNNFFNPSSRTVLAFTTVTFTWNSGSNGHDVTFDDGPASPFQTTGTYQRLFTAAGSYPYMCTVHGASMSGTITVN